MLIDTNTVDISSRSDSIDKIKSSRSKISYEMKPEEQKYLAMQEIEKQKAEENRLKRLQIYDQRNQQAHQKINSVLLR